MAERRVVVSKRTREKYSRLICLGCRERRIRCELPDEVEVPNPGELRTVQTPCYRCKRLGIPCVVRQTILGRPGSKRDSSTSPTAVDHQPAGSSEPVSRVIIELPTLLLHTPRSPETVLIIRAVDTLHRERVEREWFRHLAAHVGHTPALDLSIKALVAACAYARGVPRLTSEDCYRALALAINAVQADIKRSQGQPNDDLLASTALLAPFEGVIQQNGIPTRLHVHGLAAILAARSATYPVSQIARDILDFNAGESGVMACIQGTPSPFERVARAYFVNNRIGCDDSDRAQLKALSNELFVHTPRLVKLVRLLRGHMRSSSQLLLEAAQVLKTLLELQDSEAEGRMLQSLEVRSSDDPNTATIPVRQSLHFASIEDFEALAYYWQSRLALFRLAWCLRELSLSSSLHVDSTYGPRVFFPPKLGTGEQEMSRLIKNLLMCYEYAAALPLHKHNRLFAHATVVVWGAIRDIPETFQQTFPEFDKGLLSDLLLRKLNVTLAAKPRLIVEDMDTAADIFVGGQPHGRFAELYGS